MATVATTITAKVPKRSTFAVSLINAGLCTASAPAFASKEGAALADALVWIILVGVSSFALLAIAGGIIGIIKARKNGGSVLKSGALGLLKGAVVFVALCGVLWVLWLLFIAFAVLINL